MTKLHLSQRARLDLKAIFLHFQMEGATEAGVRFTQSFRHTCELLTKFPLLGRKLDVTRAKFNPTPQLFQIPIDRFPRYNISYTVSPDAVVVRRILHAARDPNLRLADPE